MSSSSRMRSELGPIERRVLDCFSADSHFRSADVHDVFCKRYAGTRHDRGHVVEPITHVEILNHVAMLVGEGYLLRRAEPYYDHEGWHDETRYSLTQRGLALRLQHSR